MAADAYKRLTRVYTSWFGRLFNAEKAMGWPDDMKLRSSMTLFAAADPTNDIYQKVLNKFFEGKPDEKTLALLRGGKHT